MTPSSEGLEAVCPHVRYPTSPRSKGCLQNKGAQPDNDELDEVEPVACCCGVVDKGIAPKSARVVDVEEEAKGELLRGADEVEENVIQSKTVAVALLEDAVVLGKVRRDGCDAQGSEGSQHSPRVRSDGSRCCDERSTECVTHILAQFGRIFGTMASLFSRLRVKKRLLGSSTGWAMRPTAVE